MGNRNQRQGAAGAKLTAPANNEFSLISNQKLIDLYAGLLKCRVASESRSSAREHLHSQSIVSVKGWEAGTVATTIDLVSGDRLNFLSRGTLHPWVRPLPDIFSSTAVSSNGTSAKSRIGNNDRSAQQRASQSARYAVVGAALAQRTKNDASVTVVIAQDEELAPWQEVLQIAANHSLPLIFVHQPLRRKNLVEPDQPKPKRSNSKGTTTSYLPRIPVDNNDVVAIYRVASEAIARARKGRGPTVIECQPFQIDNHASTPTGGAMQSAKTKHARDPIVAMERYLRSKGLFSPDLKINLLARSARKTGRPRKARSAGSNKP